jgi:hypothetical protein
MKTLLAFIVASCIWSGVQCVDVVAAVQDCTVTQEFGRINWLCDPQNILDQPDRDQIRLALTSMNVDPSCPCEDTNQCSKKVDLDGFSSALIPHAFTGAVIIVDEWDAQELPLQVITIYADLSMGFTACDNGVLTVYNSQLNKFYTYAGQAAKSRLSSAEISVIQSRASSQASDAERIKFLLSEMNSELRNDPLDIRTLSAYIGMGIATAIGVAALILIVIVLSSACCCKPTYQSKAPKSMHSVYSQGPPSFQGQQPYIIMPPASPTNPGDATLNGTKTGDTDSLRSDSTGHSAYNMPVPPFVDPNRPRSASSKHMDLY